MFLFLVAKMAKLNVELYAKLVKLSTCQCLILMLIFPFFTLEAIRIYAIPKLLGLLHITCHVSALEQAVVFEGESYILQLVARY